MSLADPSVCCVINPVRNKQLRQNKSFAQVGVPYDCCTAFCKTNGGDL
jgi:hypothetical protein